LAEQVELVQASHDEVASKKRQEADLLSKEIHYLSIREKELKSRVD